MDNENARYIRNAAGYNASSDEARDPKHRKPTILNLDGLHFFESFRRAPRRPQIPDAAPRESVVRLYHFLVAFDCADHEGYLVETCVRYHPDSFEGACVPDILEGNAGGRGYHTSEAEVVNLRDPTQRRNHGDSTVLELGRAKPAHSGIVQAVG